MGFSLEAGSWVMRMVFGSVQVVVWDVCHWMQVRQRRRLLCLASGQQWCHDSRQVKSATSDMHTRRGNRGNSNSCLGVAHHTILYYLEAKLSWRDATLGQFIHPNFACSLPHVMYPVWAGALRDSFVLQLHNGAQKRQRTTESCQLLPAPLSLPSASCSTSFISTLYIASSAARLAGNLS